MLGLKGSYKRRGSLEPRSGQKEVGSVRRTKLVLAALAVAVASFIAFAGPAMAVECDHVDPGVLECGKHDNVFLSEDRFGLDDGFRDDGFLFGQPFLGSGFGDEFPVWCGDHWGEFDPDDAEVDC